MPDLQTLADATSWYREWLVDAALPLWASKGFDARADLFEEALDPDATPKDAPRRSRVQTRLIWTFARAADEGLSPIGSTVAERAYDAYLAAYGRSGGFFARVIDRGGSVMDETPALYEQAFTLLAMAALREALPQRVDITSRAASLREALEGLRHPAGGFREAGGQPFQANAQMHLLESALAWERLEPGWTALADEIAGLALDRFVDPVRGLVQEFFDTDWRPLPDDAGGLIEPGHQFEWAWLLNQWGRRRGEGAARAMARRLYAAGLRGIDPARQVAVGSLWSDFRVREPVAQIWAQTEFLRAALVFDDEAQALVAARSLAAFLETPTPGLWWDRMGSDGAFVVEPSRGTALYHVLGAALPLLAR